MNLFSEKEYIKYIGMKKEFLAKRVAINFIKSNKLDNMKILFKNLSIKYS